MPKTQVQVPLCRGCVNKKNQCTFMQVLSCYKLSLNLENFKEHVVVGICNWLERLCPHLGEGSTGESQFCLPTLGVRIGAGIFLRTLALPAAPPFPCPLCISMCVCMRMGGCFCFLKQG